MRLIALFIALSLTAPIGGATILQAGHAVLSHK